MKNQQKQKAYAQSDDDQFQNLTLEGDQIKDQNSCKNQQSTEVFLNISIGDSMASKYINLQTEHSGCQVPQHANRQSYPSGQQINNKKQKINDMNKMVKLVDEIKDQQKKHKIFNNIFIYLSKYPGLGKTYQIMKKINQENIQHVYFKISRKVKSNLTDTLKSKAKGKNQYVLIIQLEELQSFNETNDFLQKLLCKMIKKNYNKSQYCPPTKLYLQIHDKQLLQKLSVLKLIYQQQKKNIYNIQNFSVDKIQYKIDNLKLGYILQFLCKYDHLLDNRSQLPTFNQYKPNMLVQQHKKLLQTYYFIPLVKLTSQPTYKQFNNWVLYFLKQCCLYVDSKGISNKNGMKTKSQYFRDLLDDSTSKKQLILYNGHLDHLMWDRIPGNEQQIIKYILNYFDKIDQDFPGSNFSTLICNISKKLNNWSSLSLNLIKWFIQIYLWVIENLPNENIVKEFPIYKKYNSPQNIRAFCISLHITYLKKLETEQMQNEIKKLINNNNQICKQKVINYDEIKQIIKFQIDYFSKKLQQNLHNSNQIIFNQSFKQSLYFMFICTMVHIPAIFIGQSGSSATSAYRILVDTLGKNKKNVKDQWLQKLPKITQFYLKGTQTCKKKDIQQKFDLASQYSRLYNLSIKKQQKNYPLVTVDDIGLVQKSHDNPLKAKYIKHQQVSFIGLSNQQLDYSIIQPLLVYKRK